MGVEWLVYGLRSIFDIGKFNEEEIFWNNIK